MTSRIDAQDESPEERSFDIRPLEYCRSHRLEMIVACLTLMRGFIAAESPTINKFPLGSFEVWDARVRQCVLWLGREFAEDFGDPINCVKISREHAFRAILSGRFDRHGDWFRGLSVRQEFDCGRSSFACFLR